jgi:FkbM family methyltransferase
MKTWIQRTARRYGYEIRKVPFADFQAAPVFDLALHYLMGTRGEALTLIQVGANAGREDDPVRPYLLKYPWRGVLIEPQPDVFEMLKLNYAGLESRLFFENVAISTSPEPLKLYRLPTGVTPSDSIVSFDPKIIAKQSGVKAQQMVSISVPTVRIDEILAKYQMTEVDVLQLDTEGYDWDALQTVDLTKVRPLLVRFEHGHLSPKTIGSMTRHLNQHGYLVYYGGYESDSIALRNDFILP